MVIIKKTDLGGEILSILTRGMYDDPRDALREYVQNGVDAGAKNIYIKIRQNNIVVIDDGSGMGYDTIRKAIRLGISEKNPKKNVGFMGIGIYSAFHLCDQLIIYSKEKNKPANKAVFDFKNMRDILEEQIERRFKNEIMDSENVALQGLLEENIHINKLSEEEFPNEGTRVELIGLDAKFYKTLTDFKGVADYLEQVIPLPFNPNFKWGQIIQKHITEICKKQKAHFEIINLELQINEQTASLYRPYSDDLFDEGSLKPQFFELKEGDDFFGIAWGCLNSTRTMIRNKELRGFLIKRQGFSIGTRHALVKYFKRQTYYNRYVGEIIVVHPKMLPNAPRTDFQFSPLRVSFYDCIIDIAAKFNDFANLHQERDKSDEELDETINHLQRINANFNQLINDSDRLFDTLWQLKDHKESLEKRYQRGYIKKSREDEYEKIISELKKRSLEVRSVIENQKKKKKTHRKTDKKIAADAEKIPSVSGASKLKYESLMDVIDTIGLEYTEELKKVFILLDEEFIQLESMDKEEYQTILKNLKQEIDELLEE